MDFNQAVQKVLDTDELFQTENVEIRGTIYKAFNKVPADLKELLEYGKKVREWEEFIVYEKEKISYLDFCNQVSKLSSFLQKEVGIKKGDKVAIAMRNYPEYLIILMAVASIGGIVVFVNAWWTTEEMEYGFDDSTAKVCFADKERLATIKPFAKKKSIKLYSVRCLDYPEIEKYDEILKNFEQVDLVDMDLKPDDDFAIMYTSGSTGHPKGVVLTHRGALTATFSWLMAERVGGLLADPEKLARRRASSVLLLSPMFHVNGSHPNFFYSIARGSKIVLMYKWDPTKAIDIISDEIITRITAVPTVVADLVQEAREQNVSLDTLEFLGAGGAKRPAAQVDVEKKALPLADIASGYGMTETNALGLGISGDEYVEKPELAGRLYPPLQEIKIVDDNDVPLPNGQLGEICLKSPANMRCYFNKKKETEAVLKDGWMHTGDLGILDDQGLVTIVDRKKNIIIRGGENISCLEVEGALQKFPGVIESVVFSVPEKRFGEEVGACINMAGGAKDKDEEISSFLRDKLAHFKIPVHYWWVNRSLPRGATDKFDRIKIKELCLNNAWGDEDG
jgi:acyl-CoA synthetase (AMP-forming)/AMP-acid ligase II